MTRLIFNLLVLILGFALATEDARAADLSGLYMGGNFGRARNSYGTGFIDGQIAGEATAVGDTVAYSAKSVQKMSDAWWGDVGYFLNPYVGIEAGFFHIGELKYIAVGALGAGGANESLVTTTEITSHGPALSLVGRLPLTEAFDVELRVGDYYGKATLDNTVTVNEQLSFIAQSKTSSSLIAGIGAAYTVAGHWSVRVDYLRVNQTGDSSTVGKFNVNLVTAGVSFTF